MLSHTKNFSPSLFLSLTLSINFTRCTISFSNHARPQTYPSLSSTSPVISPFIYIDRRIERFKHYFHA